ncbi:MAG TPA: sigma-54 dependent transcriptional regulator [Cyclobacteriaceae bacterium]|jgi:two-component system response regulator HydG
MERILVIDDDQDICSLLSRFLSKNGYEVDTASSGADALKLLRTKSYTLVLCDYHLSDMSGADLLQRIKILQPAVPVIIITGYSDVRTAVQTFKYGASDYVVKPLLPDEILITIREAINKSNSKSQAYKDASEPRRAAPREDRFIVGTSPQAETVERYINLIAPSDMSVIITGDTGTGKEYVAIAIHERSKRAGKPFVAIDCGALSEELVGSELFGHVKGSFTGAFTDKAGSFEIANTGTLFLDEIGNLSYENQAKLLRVLQERKIRRIGSTRDIDIDVRIITATNEDLLSIVKAGRFREDLYHRLNEFKIELSPLRERKGDIMIFAEHFLKKANAALGKDVKLTNKEVIEKLKNYAWYGNLRELNNVIKRAVLLSPGSEITLESLPYEIISPEPEFADTSGTDHLFEMSHHNLLKSVSGRAERQAIISTLEKTGFNKTKAAELLKIDRKTLYNKLKAYEINL